MRPHDRSQFAKLMAVLGELYRRPLSENLVGLYWAALERFDVQAVTNAVNLHVQDPDKGTFMPQPADLIFYLEGPATARGMMAWTKVYNAICHIGANRTVVFDDPLVHSVITDMGGWIKLCGMKEEESVFRAREFEKRYANYLLHPPQHYPRKLIGAIDAENMMNGFGPQEPHLLGENDKALKVYLEGDKVGAFVESRPLSFAQIDTTSGTISDKQNGLNRPNEKNEKNEI